MRRVLLIVAILLVPAIPLFLVLSGVLKKAPTTVPPIHLTVWGTQDPATAFTRIIAKYRQTRSYITVDYTQVRPQDYFQQLVQAWAQGTGPDIYFVPNAWIGQMAQYSVAEPASLAVPQVITSKGILGTSTKVVSNPKPAASIGSLQNTFVDTVTSDIVQNGQVWALPLSMDTLVTYYNKDLLNNAKVFEPAQTWSDLQNQVVTNHLTVTDQNNQLVQSGVALGTATNLPHATDLLTLLMMQNGATMVSSDGHVQFQDAAGLTALNFYLSFAQARKVNFSWDANQPNALDAFLHGKVAYYFGSLIDRTQIAASGLNWGAAPMLHIRATGDNDVASNSERFIDISDYQVAMVAKASQLGGRDRYAWNLLDYLSQAGNVTAYLQATNGLSAIKSILAQQKNDANLGVYASQLLTARSWYHGAGGQSVDGYLQALITNGLAAQSDPQTLLNLAAQQIESTL